MKIKNQHVVKNYFLLFFLSISFAFMTTDSFGQAEAGKKLFQQNCASCHKVDQDLTGPALKDIDKRKSKEWIYKWVHNSQVVIKSGDQYAIDLYNKYNKTEMTAFPQLTEGDIDNILAYIKEEGEKPATVATAINGETSGTSGGGTNNSMMAIILVVLVFIMLVLSRVTSSLDKLAKEKLGEPISVPVPIGKQLRSKKIIIPAVLILFVFGSYKTYDAASNLGRSENYQPTQPINFSHKIHAGINGIDCKYCHSSAEKGKVAGIPSVNVCMNCHKAIRKGPVTGKEEINKIYSAFESNTPVKWVKIHNLPDHVYFNHSQHVVAGGIECQTCHGPVQEMDVVKQFAPLSMGWCVNCHRNTEVKFKENGYYTMYEKLHEDMKAGNIDKVTEGRLGGTNCMKCHY